MKHMLDCRRHQRRSNTRNPTRSKSESWFKPWMWRILADGLKLVINHREEIRELWDSMTRTYRRLVNIAFTYVVERAFRLGARFHLNHEYLSNA
ncbi:MAG: hypothetical protein ACK5ZR_10360 [Gemmatimonadaceae bacterium]